VEGAGVNVLVVCEFSGEVRRAFEQRGHAAWSCDLLPAEDWNMDRHWWGDCRDMSDRFLRRFDLAICHPPCTYLASSGARWWPGRQSEQADALEFVLWLSALPIPRIAIENPIGKLSVAWRKPDQIIQPWMFGHPETKATCLWLKGLPQLEPTEIVSGREARVHREPPGEDRWKRRSRTLPGIARAMAGQWGAQRRRAA
jgi:hypothetical protein